MLAQPEVEINDMIIYIFILDFFFKRNHVTALNFHWTEFRNLLTNIRIKCILTN